MSGFQLAQQIHDARGPRAAIDAIAEAERRIAAVEIEECWLCGAAYCPGVAFDCEADIIEFCLGWLREAKRKAAL